VRRNAIEAMRMLGDLAGFQQDALPLLREAVADAKEEPLVLSEAVTALASLPGAAHDAQTLDLLDGLLGSDPLFRLPSLCRYRAAEVLSRAPDPEQHRNSLEHLRSDPVAAVKGLAEEALSRM